MIRQAFGRKALALDGKVRVHWDRKWRKEKIKNMIIIFFVMKWIAHK
jgi:hypothetical protein